MPSQLGLIHERPVLVDLRPQLPAAFDQGDEGSCGPNSASGFMCFFHQDIAQKGGFSRQQIYYNVRELEGDVDTDGGVQTNDLFAVLEEIGAAPEVLWPYVHKNLLTKPTPEVLDAASEYKVKSHSQLVSEEDFLDCLAEGFPFILGFEVFSSFESDALAKTGVMPRPNIKHERDLGGHDVLVAGYTTDFLNHTDFLKSGVDPSLVNSTALLIRNSWGPDWGLNGYFWMPVDHASNSQTGGDCWTGRL